MSTVKSNEQSRVGYQGVPTTGAVQPPPPYEAIQPVLNQPMPQGGDPVWMNAATPMFRVACPPGLETLLELDQLTIENEPVDCCNCSIQKAYTFNVKNNFDQKLFSIEPSQIGCGSFSMQLLDNSGNEIVRFERRTECCAGSSFEVIHHSSASLIGTVKVEFGFMRWTYILGDANDQTIFKVSRKNIAFLPQDIDYGITTADGSQEVGLIARIWTGWVSARKLYRITFPRNLAADMKVALLAVWFLIDEELKPRNQRISN